MKLINKLSSGLLLAVALTTAQSATADPEIEAAARAFADRSISSWVNDPLVISAIKAQNEQNASLSQNDIDTLDKQWRKESKVGNGALISKVTSNELSQYLNEVKEGGQGLMTEIFVMDDKGLNVGQSDITSDFWQGDEAKWQKTYSAGPETVFVDEVEMDESTQRFQTQVSIAISDPETGENIGAVTIGVDAENLLMQ